MPKYNETIPDEPYFEINDKPHQKGAFDLDANPTNGMVGIKRLHINDSTAYLERPVNFSAWTNNAGTPYASYDDLIADLKSGGFFLDKKVSDENIFTDELDQFKRLHPDGLGGVSWIDNENKRVYFGDTIGTPFQYVEFSSIDSNLHWYKKSGDTFVEYSISGSSWITDNLYVNVIGGGLGQINNDTGSRSNLISTRGDRSILVGDILGMSIIVDNDLNVYKKGGTIDPFDGNLLDNLDLTAIASIDRTGFFKYEFTFTAPISYIVNDVYITTSLSDTGGKLMLSAYSLQASSDMDEPLSSSSDVDNFFNGDEGVVIPSGGVSDLKVKLNEDFQVIEGEDMVVKFWSDVPMIFLGGDIGGGELHPRYLFNLTELLFFRDLLYSFYKSIDSRDFSRLNQTTEGLINQGTDFEDYLTLNFTVEKEGQYKIDGFYEWSYNRGNNDFICDVSLYDVSLMLISNISDHRQEPQDTGDSGTELNIVENGLINGSTNSGTNNVHSNSFIRTFDLNAGTYTVILKFGAEQANSESTIYKANINVELKRD